MVGRVHSGRSRALWLVLAGCGVGCGPDTTEAAELDEVCGEPGPFRLLELGDERPLAFVSQRDQIEGRRLLHVGYLDENAASYPATDGTELWSVGECGETPRRLFDDVHSFWESERWPDVLLVCDEGTGDVYTVDRLGERPSHVVFRSPGCDFRETPSGIMTVETLEGGTGAIAFQPYPTDPWTQTATRTIVLDSIRVRATGDEALDSDRDPYRLYDDELYAITPDDQLVRMSFPDGTTNVEAEGVRQFELSPDRRWLIWQDHVMTATDRPEWPEGAIFLRDRESGTVTHLADTALSYTFFSPFSFIEDGIVRLYLGGFGSEPQRFFSLADGSSFDIPPGNQATLRIEDGRWLMSGFFGSGPFSLFDPMTRTSESLFEHEGRIELSGDEFYILQATSHSVLNDWSSQGKLWSVQLDGSRRLLARRADDFYRWLLDRRIVTVLDLDDRWRGDLIVADPDSLDEHRVDDHVMSGAWVLDDGKTLLYGVSDEDRTGVWLARPAALE